MIYKTLIFLLLTTANVYAATIEKNHLEPPLSAFAGLAIVTDYFSDVPKIFKKAYDPSVKIKTIVLTSFAPEYVIGIVEKNNKYYAFKLSAKKQYWSAYLDKKVQNNIDNAPWKEVEVYESEFEISNQAYKILNEAWHQMILKTRYSQDTYGRGLDGTSYYFISSRILTGYTWSPEPNSQTGCLVELTELLGQLAESKDSKNIEKKLINTGTRLLQSLK